MFHLLLFLFSPPQYYPPVVVWHIWPLSDRSVCVCVWNLQDTAGQERFHALGPIYYRDSNGAILVYDITDEDSFQKVRFSL